MIRGHGNKGPGGRGGFLKRAMRLRKTKKKEMRKAVKRRKRF